MRDGFKMLNQLTRQPRSQGALRSRPSKQERERGEGRESRPDQGPSLASRVEYGEDQVNEVADKNFPRNSILQLTRFLFLTKQGERSLVI